MADVKKYVSLDKLAKYDAKIKSVISTGDSTTLQSAKDYADSLAKNYDAAGSAATAESNAKAYADGKDAAIQAAQQAADDAAAAAGVADGKAVAAQGEVDALEQVVAELDAYVGDIPTGYTETNVIAYVNKKAEETLNAASGGSSESAASVLAALNSYKAENDPKVSKNTEDIATAQARADEAMEHSEGVAGDLASAVEALEGADEAQVERIAVLEGQIVGLSGAMHFEGVVEVDPATITEGYENGDVVVYGEKEYVWNNGAFVEFGDVSAEGERIATLEGKMTTAEGEIDGLQEDVEALQGAVATKAEQSALDTEIQARTTAVSGLDTRLQAVEGQLGESGDVAQDIADAKAEAISTAAGDATTKANTAETNAKNYADGLNSTMNDRVVALEAIDHEHANKAELDLIATGDKAKWDAAAAIAHEHANKGVLDGITAEKVAAWDAAEGNAKTYADGLNTAIDTRVAAVEAWQTNFIEVSEQEINDLFA